MAAVLAITTARIRDGKFEEAMANYGKLRTILERAGGTVRIVSQTFGAMPGTITVVVETESWAHFGTMGEKLEKDSDYQDFLASARSNPWSDIVQRGVSAELAV